MSFLWPQRDCCFVYPPLLLFPTGFLGLKFYAYRGSLFNRLLLQAFFPAVFLNRRLSLMSLHFCTGTPEKKSVFCSLLFPHLLETKEWVNSLLNECSPRMSQIHVGKRASWKMPVKISFFPFRYFADLLPRCLRPIGPRSGISFFDPKQQKKPPTWRWWDCWCPWRAWLRYGVVTYFHIKIKYRPRFPIKEQ